MWSPFIAAHGAQENCYKIVKGLVKQLTRLREYTDQMVEDANAVIFTFGSYRFGDNDVGAQYRSRIYYYNETQAGLALKSKEAKHLELKDKIVTEILPGKTFYIAEEYHEKGGGQGLKQYAPKGCNDPIRCYG